MERSGKHDMDNECLGRRKYRISFQVLVFKQGNKEY
jgi:hypothetical protein